MNYSYNDIIKALEWFIRQYSGGIHIDDNVRIVDILNLINRQKAEIERLIAEQEEYPFKCKVGNNSEIHSKSIHDYDKLIADISAEAISPSGIRLNQRDETSRIEAVKEFAERLKAKEAIHFCKCGEAFVYTDLFNSEIDDLVKEMTAQPDMNILQAEPNT